MASTVPSGNLNVKTVAITAQNQFTSWVRSNNRNGKANNFTAWLADDSTTLNVIFTVQARPILEDGTNGSTIDIYTGAGGAGTSNAVQTAQLAGVWEVRAGVKTGGFTAGSGVAGISF